MAGAIGSDTKVPVPSFYGRRYRVSRSLGQLKIGHIVSFRMRNGKTIGGGFNFWDYNENCIVDVLAKDISADFEWADTLDAYDNFEYESKNLKILLPNLTGISVSLILKDEIDYVLKRKDLFIVLSRATDGSRPPIYAYREDGTLAWELAPVVGNPDFKDEFWWASIDAPTEDELYCCQLEMMYVVETATGRIIRQYPYR